MLHSTKSTKFTEILIFSFLTKRLRGKKRLPDLARGP